MQRAADEAGVRTLILLTPPPFDPYQRKPLDPAAREFGYKFPAVDYDRTLQQYSQWLLSLREEGQLVVDLHSTLNHHMEERRHEQVSFTVIPDSIHPNMTGHWLMALELIRQLSIAGPPFATIWNEDIPASGWQGTADLQGFAPLDPQVDLISVEQESKRGNAFCWQQLGWSKISIGKTWRLSVDSLQVGEFTSDELRNSIAVPLLRETDVIRKRQELLVKIRERRTLEYWQFRRGTDKPLGSTPPHANIPARIAELSKEIELLRQPVPCQVQLKPVD
ncbi:MAG: hypothetical protein B7Z55_18380 [Planctomycetales bacterium 12-60-4]|nr:MAG: hypothetical protein B7Z55_18380 [Planctomycetales bacterium 12-60-4]